MWAGLDKSPVRFSPSTSLFEEVRGLPQRNGGVSEHVWGGSRIEDVLQGFSVTVKEELWK